MMREANWASGDVRAASNTTVGRLFAQRVAGGGDRVAVVDGERTVSYRQLDDRSRRLVSRLLDLGVGPGDRVAILSENRLEYLDVFLAAARLGAIAACQNWRLSSRELLHCIDIAQPRVLFASERYAEAAAGRVEHTFLFGADYEQQIAECSPHDDDLDVDPESPLLILYTSGTTGLPKGAVISQRAEIARSAVVRDELDIAPTDAFVAWSPLYHMGAADGALSTLMSGGKVIVVDGYDPERLGDIVASEQLGWLVLMPGMVGRFAEVLEQRGIEPKGVRVCGAMADLVPKADIARITGLLRAPYANTFGSTETGNPPCSSHVIAPGVAPTGLAKLQSPMCEIRLVDSQDGEVEVGQPGELCMRGPTLFSGYWREPEVNAREFRGGWFHMGDVLVRNADGTLDFVDRVKYLIKSGGENIYPAEIERVLLGDPRVADVAVVKQVDDEWGEVPVAFVARRDASVSEDELRELCASGLSRYKHPKRFVFIGLDEFPRSVTGKIQRSELEARLRDQRES